MKPDIYPLSKKMRFDHCTCRDTFRRSPSFESADISACVLHGVASFHYFLIVPELFLFEPFFFGGEHSG